MKIQSLLNFMGYSLIVCRTWENLYCLSIIDQDYKVHNFEGIYPSLQNAIEQGKSVIQNLEYLRQKTSY